MTETDNRPTLRDLPLPAKLVLTAFLISVGLGYGWALLQLHFKHASKGNLAPTPEDVVERFSGQHAPWAKPEPPLNDKQVEPKPLPGEAKMVAGIKIKTLINLRCVDCHSSDGEKSDAPLENYAQIQKYLDDPPPSGKFHKLIAKGEDDAINKDSMRGAFTTKTEVEVQKMALDWKVFVKKFPQLEEKVRSERDTERLAMIAWLEAGAPKDAYEKDAFPLPEELAKRAINDGLATQAPELPKKDGGEPVRRKRDPKQRQLSVESLTQSTHAHLLTFSILWAGTGLVFAFTSFPLWMRIGIAPVVLIAQIADICCWWLARLPGSGPYFALAIMGTGAIVGLGLGCQIVLSLFNMYDKKGKFIILLLLLGGGAAGGVVYTKYIAPMIADEKQAAGG